MGLLKAWLRLFRLSGLLTVFSNALASCVFITYDDAVGWRQLAEKVFRNREQAVWVLATSCLLYLCGMVWNDLIDADRDRQLHPDRPLPSGRIPLEAAFTAACLLAVGSLLVASRLGYRGFTMAGVVLVLSLLYNTVAKQVPIFGALVMAAVRFAHAVFVLLMLDHDTFDRVVLTLVDGGPGGLLAAAGMGSLPAVYPWLLGSWIFATTWISELESRRGRRFELLLAGLFLVVPVVACAWELFTARWLVVSLQEYQLAQGVIGVLWALGLMTVLLVRVVPSWWQAVRDLERVRIPGLTARLLGSLILFDAVLVAARQPIYAFVVLTLWGAFALSSLVARMD